MADKHLENPLDYLYEELSPGDMEEARRHLARCPECRAVLRGIKEGVKAYRSADRPVPPPGLAARATAGAVRRARPTPSPDLPALAPPDLSKERFEREFTLLKEEVMNEPGRMPRTRLLHPALVAAASVLFVCALLVHEAPRLIRNHETRTSQYEPQPASQRRRSATAPDAAPAPLPDAPTPGRQPSLPPDAAPVLSEAEATSESMNLPPPTPARNAAALAPGAQPDAEESAAAPRTPARPGGDSASPESRPAANGARPAKAEPAKADAAPPPPSAPVEREPALGGRSQITRLPLAEKSAAAVPPPPSAPARPGKEKAESVPRGKTAAAPRRTPPPILDPPAPAAEPPPAEAAPFLMPGSAPELAVGGPETGLAETGPGGRNAPRGKSDAEQARPAASAAYDAGFLAPAAAPASAETAVVESGVPPAAPRVPPSPSPPSLRPPAAPATTPGDEAAGPAIDSYYDWSNPPEIVPRPTPIDPQERIRSLLSLGGMQIAHGELDDARKTVELLRKYDAKAAEEMATLIREAEKARSAPVAETAEPAGEALSAPLPAAPAPTVPVPVLEMVEPPEDPPLTVLQLPAHLAPPGCEAPAAGEPPEKAEAPPAAPDPLPPLSPAPPDEPRPAASPPRPTEWKSVAPPPPAPPPPPASKTGSSLWYGTVGREVRPLGGRPERRSKNARRLFSTDHNRKGK